MKKRCTPGTKALTTKLKVIPNNSDIIKTKKVQFEQLPSECDIVGIPIKQEESNLEMKHYSATFSEIVAGVSTFSSFTEPSINNDIIEELNSNTTESSPQFDCQHCELTFKSETLYNKHVYEAYKLELDDQQPFCQTGLARIIPKPNHNIVPDPEDPNFYCKSCDTKYATRLKLRDHIRYWHKTVNLPKKTKPNHSIEPDPEDPNFYCKSCNMTYATRAKFRDHIGKVHKTVDLRPKRPKPNHSIEPNPNDPNKYCKSCDTKYATVSSFRAHIRDLHKSLNLPLLVTRRTFKSNRDIEPDPEDPNYYCKSCDKKYATSAKFRGHIGKVHKTVNLPRKRRKLNHSVEPDPHDPNFYCKSCDIKHATSVQFRSHIRHWHKTIELLLQRRPTLKPNHNIEPDPEDPDYYCKSCDTKYANRFTFRGHIHRVHKTVDLPPRWKRTTKRNHNIEPDPNDPNFYCKSCDSTYTSETSFRGHISSVHKTVDLRLRRKPNSYPNRSIET